jgi:ubiquinone/menaquinone biosynthesis C-methylase UbiE
MRMTSLQSSCELGGHLPCYDSSVMSSTVIACEWPGYVVEDFPFTHYPPGSRVVDIGFGSGHQVRALLARGCRAYGIEYSDTLARRGASSFPVCRATAEHLPLASASLDGLLCKVVIPYTDEAKALAEIGRVLRPGGVARVSYHGVGYSLYYLLTDPNWKRRVYGLRTIINTWLYRMTGLRLPGFWGDTIYQSSRRLRRYYAKAGLALVEEHPAATFAGGPVFIYHVLQKAATKGAAGTGTTMAATPRATNALSGVADNWSAFVANDYRFTEFPVGSRVLDVGFGHGTQMRAAALAGCRMFGIEYDATLTALARTDALAVCQASSEQLPFVDASLDGVICKVVILLTDEAKSIAEIGRVLRQGGIARLSYHGIGYSLRYLFTHPDWKHRVYAARTIVNTLVYRLTGRRLPGFLGDTLFQTSSRLQRYYTRAGLELVEEHPSPRFAGAPVFIYHTVRKAAAAGL